MAIYHKGQRMDGGSSGGGMSQEEADQRYLQKTGGELESETFTLTAEDDSRLAEVSVDNYGVDISTIDKASVGSNRADFRETPGSLSMRQTYNILSTSLELTRGALTIESDHAGAAVTEFLEFDARSGLRVSKCAEPEKDTMPATKGYVDQAVSGVSGVPSGAVILWSGTVANIPDGWALCNGSNGTPDLRNRFVVGAGSTYSVGATGGEATHRLTAGEMPAHTHGIPTSGGSNSSVSGSYVSMNSGKIRTDTLFTAANGLTEAHNNMPPYYALCYIMKL